MFVNQRIIEKWLLIFRRFLFNKRWKTFWNFLPSYLGVWQILKNLRHLVDLNRGRRNSFSVEFLKIEIQRTGARICLNESLSRIVTEFGSFNVSKSIVIANGIAISSERAYRRPIVPLLVSILWDTPACVSSCAREKKFPFIDTERFSLEILRKPTNLFNERSKFIVTAER